MTPYVNIFRTKRSDHGTEGILSTGNFTCFTLELPWKDNRPDISCIPDGTYRVRLRTSPRHGRVYHLTGVEQRTRILMHSGNLAGDVSKGLRTHANGCILLPKDFRLKLLTNVRSMALSAGIKFAVCREGLSQLNTACCDGSWLLQQLET